MPAVSLREGMTLFAITVIAVDGSNKTYTVEVMRNRDDVLQKVESVFLESRRMFPESRRMFPESHRMFPESRRMFR
jgi:hypothetical protein